MTFPTPLPGSPKLTPRRPFAGQRAEYVRPLTEEELREFLEDTADLQKSLDLWDRLSGLPGLLDTEPERPIRQAAYKPVAIYFDELAGVYRYVQSGRRVPQARVALGVLRVSKAMERDLRELTAALVRGEISQGAWYQSMLRTMRETYRAAYLAAIGGRGNYDRSAISRFGWMMRPHYRWLENFLSELQSGEQKLNGFAVMRAGMYARAANAIYQNARARVAEQSGFRQARRVLGPNEEHCEESGRPGCIELAARGWVPIGELVPIGEATCLSHCLCGLEFRR